MEQEVKRDDSFVAFNEAGEQKVFYKLFEFDSKETGKRYLAYTDNETDENGNLKAYGSIVEPSDKSSAVKLKPIETEKEWKVIEMALKVLQDDLNGKKDEED